MPQISIIRYSDIKEAHRFDAEYFKPEYLEIEEVLTNYQKLNELSENIVCGPFGSTILDSTYTNIGIEVIRPFNIKDCKIEDENIVFISEEDIKAKNLKLFYYGDLFFARVGDIKVGMLTHQLATISPNIIAVKINKKKSNPYYLSIFLNSKYGLLQLQRGQKIVAQPTISTNAVRNLKIPILPESFQLEIARIVKNAHEKQIQSKQLYKEAEVLFLKELGLVDYKPKHQLTFETSRSEVQEANRFDAEYFQPKYEEIIKKIENYKGGFDNIGSYFKLINGRTPEKYDNEKNDIQVLKTKQIRNEAIDYSGLSYTESNYVNYTLEDRDILFASMGVGSLGRTGIFYKFETNQKTSIDSTIKVLKKTGLIEPEVLQIFLNSSIGQQYIYRYIVGSTGIISIKNDFILALKIPLIDKNIQRMISNKVLESHKNLLQSKNLLEEAKRKVEEEIEKS